MKQLTLLCLVVFLTACQGSSSTPTPTLTFSSDPIVPPPTETLTQAARLTGTSLPTYTPSPVPLYLTPTITGYPPVELPQEINNILIYTVLHPSQSGSHNPPRRQLFYTPLGTDGNTLDAAQPWFAKQFVVGLIPSPNYHYLAVWHAHEHGDSAWVLDHFSGERPFLTDTLPPDHSASPITFLGWTASGNGILHGKNGTISLSGESDQILVKKPAYRLAYGAALSPDNQVLVYSLADNDSEEIPDGTWLLILHTQTTENLFDFSISHFTWSPDGHWIAFSTSAHHITGTGDKGFFLMLMRPDGSDMQLVSESSVGNKQFLPAWSPGGDSLAFMARGNAPDDVKGDFKYNAYVADMNEDGVFNVRPVVSGTEFGHIDPSWSPDGTSLLIVAGTRENADVWLVSRDGETMRQLTFEGGRKRYPVWLRFE